MTQAYPLAWPMGWPRTKSPVDARNRFIRGGAYGGQPWTFAGARDALYAELEKLGAPSWNVILSSNFQLNQRGEPHAGRGRPLDQGVAVYFRIGDKPQLVMACDRFTRAEENMRSLALAIEAMRQLERHGGGVMMERAFEGFAALPAPGRTPWWSVLGLNADATLDQIEAAFRRLANERHPDKPGGSDAMMADLNRARDEARKARSP